MAKVTDLTGSLPVCQQMTFLPQAHAALSQPSDFPGFVAPPLRLLTKAEEGFRRPIVLVSAPGAVGKSTLAAHISADRATALWDLARLRIGDNTFLGTLATTFGASQLPGILDGINRGRTLFVFDAFDEAELLSGWDRVESFVQDLWSHVSGAPLVAAVLLARTETAARLDSLLTGLSGDVPRHTLVEIDFFDEEGARRFIERQLERVHKLTAHVQHPAPFQPGSCTSELS